MRFGQIKIRVECGYNRMNESDAKAALRAIGTNGKTANHTPGVGRKEDWRENTL
jgi:hypothetical protein